MSLTSFPRDAEVNDSRASAHCGSHVIVCHNEARYSINPLDKSAWRGWLERRVRMGDKGFLMFKLMLRATALLGLAPCSTSPAMADDADNLVDMLPTEIADAGHWWIVAGRQGRRLLSRHRGHDRNREGLWRACVSAMARAIRDQSRAQGDGDRARRGG